MRPCRGLLALMIVAFAATGVRGALTCDLEFDDATSPLTATVGENGISYITSNKSATQVSGLGELYAITDADVLASAKGGAIGIPKGHSLAVKPGLAAGSAWCLELRFYLPAGGTYYSLLSLNETNSGDGWLFVKNDSTGSFGGNIGCWGSYEPTTLGSSLYGRWNTLVLSVDASGTATLYVNGELLETSTGDYSLDGKDHFFIGADEDGEDALFYVDSVKVYSEAKPDAVFPANKFGSTTSRVQKYRGLPSGYTQVESITSSAAQLIDSGIVPGEDTAVDCSFGNIVYKQYFAVFGQEWGSSRYLLNSQNGTMYFHSTGSGVVVSPYYSETSNAGLNCQIETNGTLVLTKSGHSKTNTVSLTVGQSKHLALFGQYTTSDTTYLASLAMYGMKIWKNGILIRDFVPATRDSDSKPGLYDLYTRTFFVNTLSGADFTAGAALPTPAESPSLVSTGAEVLAVPDSLMECYRFTDPTTPGTLVIPEGGASVDLLLVGGGGAGGFCRGGGGGGGGVVYSSGVTLAAGTYTITVGAGGVPDVFDRTGSCNSKSASSATTDGGKSRIELSGVVIKEVVGGGGGGSFVNSNVSGSSGRSGGSGGGSAGKCTVQPKGTSGQGNAGGAAYSASDWSTGGGGGAGEAGGDATSANLSGDGGDGTACSITGTSVVYGGGGGGGNDSNSGTGVAGKGGAGGGGDGSATTSMSAYGFDGLGGGGGGASSKGDSFDYAGGGAGGSGVVIVRYIPASPAPTISNFSLTEACYDSAKFSVSVPRIGSSATSANAHFEAASDADFNTIVSTADETLTGEWIKSSYEFSIPPTTDTRYVRLIVDNGSYASTSSVVSVSLKHAFVLSGCGAKYVSGGLSVTVAISSLAASSADVALYVDGSSSPSASGTITSAGDSSFTLSGVTSAATIRAVITATGKTQEYSFTVTPGTTRYVVGDVSQHTSGTSAIVASPGDTIVFPEGYTYRTANIERHVTLSGNVATLNEAGIVAIRQFTTSGTAVATAVVVIKPSDMAADGRVFIYDFANNNGWADSKSWKQVGVESNDSYPNASTDVAYIPVTATSAQTVKVVGTNTVQDLYIGRPGPTAGEFSLVGSAADGDAIRIAGYDTEKTHRAGRLELISACESANHFVFYIGGSGSSKHLAIIAEKDVDFDLGGPTGTLYGATTNTCYTKVYTRDTIYTTAHVYIAEGATFAWVNGQNHTTSVDMQWQGSAYACCTNFVRGKGTYRIQTPGVFTDWGYTFSSFEGTFVDAVRNNITQASSNRGGNFWGYNFAAPKTTMRIEGHNTSAFSEKTSVGHFCQGNTHGYSDPGAMPENGLPDAGLEMAGGSLRLYGMKKAKAGYWPRTDGDYEVHNFTDKLTIDAGLSYIYHWNSWMSDTGLPIMHFCASNVVHKNSGTLYVLETRTRNNVTTGRLMTELHGLSDHYVGYTGAEDAANDVFPIVPWFLTRIDDNTWNPWWGHVDSDGIMCRGGSRTKTALNSVTDPNRNVFSSSTDVTISKDVTVNSLVINAYGYKHTLGEGRTLTITSGGLVLASSKTSIGTATGGTANGSLVFPNRAYVHAMSMEANNPNQIWSPITAPKGFVQGFTGYFVLGGDQTGIDEDITLNNGTTWLGAKDGSGDIAIDVPIKMVGGNTRLVLTRAGLLSTLTLNLTTAGGYSPKIEVNAGVSESCGKVYIDGVSLRRGTYGATGSGAANIDDEHFAGTGTLTVLKDDNVGFVVLFD